MRADDEACDLCGAAPGQPHRLRCTRVIDEQHEAREFEESAGVQFALVAGVACGMVTLAVSFMLGGSVLVAWGSALGVGGGVLEFLRRVAESRRDAKAKQGRRGR